MNPGLAGAIAPITERELLELYRPHLRYDSAETVFAQPASRTGEVIGEDRVYGRIADDDDRRYLQYWLFYARNDQDRGVVDTGRHEGDWEFVQLRLAPDGPPDEVAFAQHSWAEVCAADQVEFEDGAPVVYVANGSHASYPRAGTADRPWPDPNDEADGGGQEALPEVTMLTETRPEWVTYSGRWGDAEAGIVPGEQSSPFGPMFQPDGRWQEPANYVSQQGIPCGDGPPGRWWQLPGLLAVAGAAIAGLVWWRRYRA